MTISIPKTFGVLDKVEIVDLHVVSMEAGDPLATLPEDGTYTAWAAGTFALGDYRYQASTHTVYVCIKAHTTAGGKEPKDDGENWNVFAVTNKWKMFDLYRSTATAAQDRLKVVLRPRAMVDTIDLQGLIAQSVEVTVQDGVGGPVVLNSTHAMDANNVTDWEEYFFGVVLLSDSLYIPDVPIVADPVITIDLSFADQWCGIGSLQLGRYVALGWTEYDSDIGVVSYSYLKRADDGTIQWRRRPGAGDINVRVFVEPADTNQVATILGKYDGVPTLWIGHTDPNYAPLRKTGFFNGRLTYTNYGQRLLSGRVEGLI